MTKFNIATLVNSILLISLIIIGGVFFYNKEKVQKIAYVDTIKLFNEFNMTKDIKNIEERKIKNKATFLDSIYKKLQEEKDIETPNYKSLQIQVAKNSKELQEMQNNYTTNLSQQVWNRLNSYISEYCEIKDINIVFGTSGDGNVMYAKENFNITKELLTFSNAKYEGN